MIKGGIRIGGFGISGYDADAAAYFDRAGVTDTTAKTQINAFVKGLKSLGAWNNSIVYLARSAQNKGSGSTIYSFGGLTNNTSTYDATIAGSPTPIWTKSGITTNGGYWSATSPISGGNTTRSMIAMSQRSASTAANTEYVVLSTAGIGTKRFAFRQDTIKKTQIDIFDYDAIFGARYDSSAGFNFQSASYNSSSSSLRYNANAGTDSTATQSLSFSTGGITSGGWESAVPYAGAGTLSMALVSNQFFSKTLCDAIYSLYNSTCGTNLYDVDAETYFTTAGITDTTAKQQISDFVVGVKGLGLWNNMVCWPLRSSQNAGTGTTAYSLGGLGTYNGTLTNGPTWGTDGITFDGTNDYISTALTSGFSALSVFGISKKDATSQTMAEIFKDDEVANRDWEIFAELGGSVQSRLFNPLNSQITGPSVTTNFRVSCLRGSSTINKFRINNGSDNTATTGTINQGSAPVTFGAKSNGGDKYFKGIMAGVIIYNSALSDSDTSSIYTLYKTTLATGLGLP